MTGIFVLKYLAIFWGVIDNLLHDHIFTLILGTLGVAVKL